MSLTTPLVSGVVPVSAPSDVTKESMVISSSSLIGSNISVIEARVYIVNAEPVVVVFHVVSSTSALGPLAHSSIIWTHSSCRVRFCE